MLEGTKEVGQRVCAVTVVPPYSVAINVVLCSQGPRLQYQKEPIWDRCGRGCCSNLRAARAGVQVASAPRTLRPIRHTKRRARRKSGRAGAHPLQHVSLGEEGAHLCSGSPWSGGPWE